MPKNIRAPQADCSDRGICRYIRKVPGRDLLTALAAVGVLLRCVATAHCGQQAARNLGLGSRLGTARRRFKL